MLFDKSHKGYKEKVAVENAWNEVADGLDFIENGIYNLAHNLLLKYIHKDNLLTNIS